jgi:hypothetical protein
MKNLSKLGKALNKAEQQLINGGKLIVAGLTTCSQATSEQECRHVRGTRPCHWYNGPSGGYCHTTEPHIAL